MISIANLYSLVSISPLSRPISKAITSTAKTSDNTKPITSLGSMPTKVFVKPRANATAGLEKKVEDVNQYPAVTVKATSMGSRSFAWTSPIRMTDNSTRVDINSLIHIPYPFLSLVVGPANLLKPA